ncbi:solute carrier family 35 member F6 [Harpegnathos saltator]|uniref:Transmembrane protein C2orf18 n=1 Tax=Harpegnathos saltator TaxID=610380 RepID=E2BZ82_HARSA|nr:solute carrier family 35 member F6 [Harpegnathos saltator]XP_011147824.1 solute carrier family 35 member F6 [Harpegnathos saltator]XP_011147825.1 solute carrier family 35 member F6 [Harpegnathos saltator]XP_025155949.1 solute carrier family 35 member F6 [Harpegnathos saltator]EFN78988.1 Transmembrane protein C2orf18 [Harpegnathos saltator]
MAWTNYQRILAILQVTTGSFNTLSVKFADQQEVVGDDGQVRHFNHPFMQSSFMFFGEALCFVAFKFFYYYYNRRADGSVDNNVLTKGTRIFNPFILLIPALCDMCATSIMYIGLNMTYASSFQMLRGAVIVFTGIFSIVFLHRKLRAWEWTGIAFVIVGLALVGASDMLTSENADMDTNSMLTGDLLIIFAQVITAIQMVVEEKFVGEQDIPALQAIGWEGIFGFIGICLVMIPLNFIKAPPPFADNSRGTLEHSVEALIQIGNSSKLLIAVIGIAFSIAFFNYAGISVTKEINATTRMILDSVRTVIIWAFSLAFGWQAFHYMQVIGFTVLLIGMACYNKVVIPQLFRKLRSRRGRHTLSGKEDHIVNTAADDVQETI